MNSQMLSSIRNGTTLKKVDCSKINDRSVPRIQKDSFKLKSSTRYTLLSSIRQGTSLKKVDCSKINDRSVPRIQKDVIFKLKETNRGSYLDSVLQGVSGFYSKLFNGVSSRAHIVAQQSINGAVQLTHAVTHVVDSAAHQGASTLVNAIDTTSHIVSDVTAKSIDTINDIAQHGLHAVSSAGENIHETLTHEKRNAKKELEFEQWSLETRSNLAEIESNRQQLSHVRWRSIHDASKPFLPSSYALRLTGENATRLRQEGLKRSLTAEIVRSATMKSLNHVATKESRWMPSKDEVNLKKLDRKAFLSSIENCDASGMLTKPEKCEDRSAPLISKGETKMMPKGAYRSAILADIASGVELQKNHLVKDRSAPALPAM